MPSSLSRIFGWVPPSDETFVEVNMPQQPPPYQPVFHMADSDCTEPSSPASSTSSVSDAQDRRSDTSCGKDNPSWVARPRNEFILFRCDYVRKHTKEGANKRSRRQPGQEKTLSKLAAEAWRALSSEERFYWREQANLERTEHALKYPDYRYRPKKSATARKRQTRSSIPVPVVTKPTHAPAILDPTTVDANPSTLYAPPMAMVECADNSYLDNGNGGAEHRKPTALPLLTSPFVNRPCLPIHSHFSSSDSPSLAQKYLNAVSGGHPSHQQIPTGGPHPSQFRQRFLAGDAQWGPGSFHQPSPVNGALIRTPGLLDQFFSPGPGYDYQHIPHGIEMPPATGVFPGEYFSSSAEMTPEEALVIEEYFPSY